MCGLFCEQSFTSSLRINVKPATMDDVVRFSVIARCLMVAAMALLLLPLVARAVDNGNVLAGGARYQLIGTCNKAGGLPRSGCLSMISWSSFSASE